MSYMRWPNATMRPLCGAVVPTYPYYYQDTSYYMTLSTNVDTDDVTCRMLLPHSRCLLQTLVATEESAKITRAKLVEGGGTKVELLRKHLIYAIEHGAEAPLDRNNNAVEVLASNILALLYGREEMDEVGSFPAPPPLLPPPPPPDYVLRVRCIASRSCRAAFCCSALAACTITSPPT
jgi:hypothetical protein